MIDLRPLTSEEHEGVTRFALGLLALNPNFDWKVRLRKKWTSGTAEGALLSLMITHGPEWLEHYSLSEWPMERFRKPHLPD